VRSAVNVRVLVLVKIQRSANSREQQPCTAAPTLGAMPGVAWLTSPDA
jgi:hypothetical protein